MIHDRPEPPPPTWPPTAPPAPPAAPPCMGATGAALALAADGTGAGVFAAPVRAGAPEGGVAADEGE